MREVYRLDSFLTRGCTHCEISVCSQKNGIGTHLMKMKSGKRATKSSSPLGKTVPSQKVCLKTISHACGGLNLLQIDLLRMLILPFVLNFRRHTADASDWMQRVAREVIEIGHYCWGGDQNSILGSVPSCHHHDHDEHTMSGRASQVVHLNLHNIIWIK